MSLLDHKTTHQYPSKLHLFIPILSIQFLLIVINMHSDLIMNIIKIKS